jgi:hypothetical protein
MLSLAADLSLHKGILNHKVKIADISSSVLLKGGIFRLRYQNQYKSQPGF